MSESAAIAYPVIAASVKLEGGETTVFASINITAESSLCALAVSLHERFRTAPMRAGEHD